MIGKLDFFHRDIECGELESTFALKGDILKFGFKF